jgi:hypothetical protein
MSLTNYGGGWISSLWFRGDLEGTQFAVDIPNMTVRISITSKGLDSLSGAFAENLGRTSATFFSGSFHCGVVAGQFPPPESFSCPIVPPEYFFYDPREGNLLLDVQIFAGNTTTNFCIGSQFGCIRPWFDVWDRPDDSVASVYSPNVGSSTGVVASTGLASDFGIFPNPHLVASQSTNVSDAITLSWPRFPQSFVLQRSPSLTSQANWQPVTSGIVTSPDGYVQTLIVPAQNGSELRTEYFRLVSPTKTPSQP